MEKIKGNGKVGWQPSSARKTEPPHTRLFGLRYNNLTDAMFPHCFHAAIPTEYFCRHDIPAGRPPCRSPALVEAAYNLPLDSARMCIGQVVEQVSTYRIQVQSVKVDKGSRSSEKDVQRRDAEPSRRKWFHWLVAS